MNVIEVQGLVKRYGEFVALNHLDLEVKEGEVLGLLGPNGSGKSTAIHCILSLLKYDHGTIKIFGKDMTPNALDIKKEIGFVMQNIGVFEELTVYENIDYFCGLYIADAKVRKQYVAEAIDFVGLNDFKKHYPKKLSGGLLRRLNIACGIAHKPKLIILDEPTVAVDPQSRNNILEGIQRLNQEGATILYTSHYMEEIEQICTRVVIIDNGKQIASGTKEELKEMSSAGEKVVFEIYQLEEEYITAINQKNFVLSANYEKGILTIYCTGSEQNIAKLIEFMNENNLDFLNVHSSLPTLNDVFLEITGKQLRD